MANERDQEQDLNETGQQNPQPTGQQPPQDSTAQQDQGQQSQGQSSSGQASPDQGGDTATLAGSPGQGQASAGSPDTNGSEQSGGFVGSQPSGSDDYLREGNSDSADFAKEGQGALDPQSSKTGTETGQSSEANRDESGSDAQ